MSNDLPAPPASKKLRWKIVGVVVLFVFIAGGYWLTGKIESALLFPAPQLSVDSDSGTKFELRDQLHLLTLPGGASVPIPNSVGRGLMAWSGFYDPTYQLLEPFESRETSPLLIYCHGNGELIGQWMDAFDEFRNRGFWVLLCEYPGYGSAEGKPSEKSIQQTLMYAYDIAIQQPGIDPQCVIGWGRSLGGGAICTLAEERPLAAVILESTFSSVGEVAYEQFGVPSFFIRNQFNNLATVKSLKVPLLILHGEQDQAISVANARRLHAAAPGSELEILSCDHNDCPDASQRILQFLTSRGVVKKEESATDER
ncbi:alpha/beta hydrolase [Planctomicrobium piriforme]|uniref:Serine aminopeptidase, S33 n=1 Tax=Planctomicrobium piriforme TaxID=1576369 RepID=A0A1I3IC55_9PLAN|nr:alpha/beta hydrolase [Planctomicrobium piriforme]SFI45526.1 Serine aminopeptidase, S33 [Planctomicrobium piriforme]